MINLDEILYRVTKPARYTGGEWNSVVKEWDSTSIKVVLSYPDLYDVGMSNLGLAIIYDVLNHQPDVLAERTFAPWVDMEAEMRRAGMPLFSLESRRPVKDFDILGFSLGYELTYTNLLNILDLSGIPVLAAERGESVPLVIAGGSCAFNPEPMADFIDLFVVGEGEEVVLELLSVFRKWKGKGSGWKQGFLREA
ncbi:MAG TPA: B12-binding domain-containing radical SAM protein, partial [Dehalococcoidia bacterium]|nr:B12-binding domain-containing radical SAM protein [Dehalococcoidia bacterium]